eukprot:7745466-Lingulodinium_polyedra.AAC.1
MAGGREDKRGSRSRAYLKVRATGMRGKQEMLWDAGESRTGQVLTAGGRVGYLTAIRTVKVAEAVVATVIHM